MGVGTIGRRRTRPTEVSGMAHCFIMDVEGATAAQYDAVIEDMELEG